MFVPVTNEYGLDETTHDALIQVTLHKYPLDVSLTPGTSEESLCSLLGRSVHTKMKILQKHAHMNGCQERSLLETEDSLEAERR